MPDALDYNIQDWEKYLARICEPKFRAKQIFTWLHKGVDFDEMSNLPKKLQENLKKDFGDFGDGGKNHGRTNIQS